MIETKYSPFKQEESVITLQKNISSSEWWRQSILLLNLVYSNRIAETLQKKNISSKAN